MAESGSLRDCKEFLVDLLKGVNSLLELDVVGRELSLEQSFSTGCVVAGGPRARN